VPNRFARLDYSSLMPVVATLNCACATAIGWPCDWIAKRCCWKLPATRLLLKLLSKDEARRIAENVAKLPELLPSNSDV
jgi:hypothetical protein